MEKVVFLDRDGTINIERNYLYRLEDFQFIRGVPEAIRKLNEANFKVVVITNQAGIARGYYSEEDVQKLHQYINEELKKNGAYIDCFYYCPHHPKEGIDTYKVNCNCRKPKIGMLLKTEEKYQIDKENSWFIGDNRGDILAGQNYNIKTILVSTGYGKKVYLNDRDGLIFDYYAKDLPDAVNYILSFGI